MSMGEGRQLVLVPDEPLDLEQTTLDIALLAEQEVQHASAQLVDSIRRFGMLQPILVRSTFIGGFDGDGIEHGEYRYDVVDGRRRLDAARRLMLDEIPCLVAHTDLAIADVATLAANATRSANPIAEFEAIQRLVKGGASEKEIASATGMTRQTISARSRLLALNQGLLDGFRTGKIAASVAQDLAKLPGVIQARALAELHKKGKLTAKDVHELRTAKAQAAAAMMTNALFDLPEEQDEAPVEERVERQLAVELQGIIERMPQEQRTLIRSLEWVAELLGDLAAGGEIDTELVTVPMRSLVVDTAIGKVSEIDTIGTVYYGHGEEPDDADTSDETPYPAELADDERYPHARGVE